MRTKTFAIEVHVADELMRSHPKALDLAREAIRERAREALRGPRGGRYEPVGEVRDIRGGQNDTDWLMNRWSFVGHVDAKYVRPARV